jgi:hypothetical protein
MFNANTYKLSGLKAKIILLLTAIVFGSFSHGISGMEGNEYQIKAMFVLNFTKYVEWPDLKSSDIFIIGVVGESDIIEPLERIATQKKVGDKKIIIKTLTLDDEDYCNIIIVSKSKLNKLEQIEKKYSGKGVLVISDEAQRSAAINLVTRDNKIRFEVNQSLARSGGVKISSQLLSLAVEVH